MQWIRISNFPSIANFGYLHLSQEKLRKCATDQLPFEALKLADITDNDSIGIKLYLASIAVIFLSCEMRLDMNCAASIPPRLLL